MMDSQQTIWSSASVRDDPSCYQLGVKDSVTIRVRSRLPAFATRHFLRGKASPLQVYLSE